MRSRLRFAALLGLFFVIVAGILIIFHVRLDNQDLTPTPPTASETLRQQVAETAARIAASSSDDDVSAAAQRWESEVGGVWLAWPNGAPEGYSNTPVNTAPAPESLSSDLTWLVENAPELDDSRLGVSLALEAQSILVNLGEIETCPAVDLQSLSKLLSADILADALAWYEAAAAVDSQVDIDSAPLRLMLRKALTASIEGGEVDARAALRPLPDDPGSASISLLRAALIEAGATASADDLTQIAALGCLLATSPHASSPDAWPELK